MSELYDHRSMMGKVDDLIINLANASSKMTTAIHGLSEKVNLSNAIADRSNKSAELGNKRMFWLSVAIAGFAGVEAVGVVVQALTPFFVNK